MPQERAKIGHQVVFSAAEQRSSAITSLVDLITFAVRTGNDAEVDRLDNMLQALEALRPSRGAI